jgi:hypothetical protein
MTPEEDALFREAAKKALALEHCQDVVMVLAEVASEFEPFTVLLFLNAAGIVIPREWAEREGIDEHCQAILRQENRLLQGDLLD